VKGLFMCQVTAMLICGTGVFSNLLVTKNVNIPTLQSFGNYLCLSLVYTTSYVYTTSPSDLKRNLKAKWWKYLILAAFDVEGNYLMVKVNSTVRRTMFEKTLLINSN
jgi:solute carrier family 35 protein F1/2